MPKNADNLAQGKAISLTQLHHGESPVIRGSKVGVARPSSLYTHVTMMTLSLSHSPLLVGQLGAGLGDGLHGRGHVVVPLGLLGQLGALDLLLLVGHVERRCDKDEGNAKNKLRRSKGDDGGDVDK